ncbi:unnamed protein product [Ectocarpus sp. 8 AP-2014]
MHPEWRTLMVWLGIWGLVAGDENECLLGLALQGLDPFESADWGGISVCDSTLAVVGGDVVTNFCTPTVSYSSPIWTYTCIWSMLDCTVSTDDKADSSCTCQACGGLPSDMEDYMVELEVWDRVRCAAYALEEAGYDVTPCVEAVVDTMSMPGVDEEWTSPGVSSIDCLTIEDATGSDGSYHNDDACAYPGTTRLAVEVFGDGVVNPTPAPGGVYAPTASPAPSPAAPPAADDAPGDAVTPIPMGAIPSTSYPNQAAEVMATPNPSPESQASTVNNGDADGKTSDEGLTKSEEISLAVVLSVFGAVAGPLFGWAIKKWCSGRREANS